MADGSRVGEALARCEAALSRLEAAMARWHDRERALGRLKGEAEALRRDRSRLAEELDEVRAKASELAEADRQAAKRIDAAMARIRGVLGG